MMIISSKIAPGVLALTLARSTGMPRPSRKSIRPSLPNESNGRPVADRARRENSGSVTNTRSLCTVTPRWRKRPRVAGAAAGIETPDLLAGGRVHRHDLQRRRRHVEDSVDDDRLALHLGAFEGVVRVVRPRHLELRDVPGGDLLEGGIAGVVLAAVHRPADVRRRRGRQAGPGGRGPRTDKDGGSRQRGKNGALHALDSIKRSRPCTPRACP